MSSTTLPSRTASVNARAVAALAILLLKLSHVVRMQGDVAAEHNSADLLGELPKSAQRRRASAVDEPAEAEAAQYGGRALKQTQER